jgi:hypothetical protein
MGNDPLDFENDEFWRDMKDVIFVCVKKDRTINLKTSILDMGELKSVFSTAYTMALFHDMKINPKDIDKMH